MNPSRAKFLSWALATLMGAALCVYVFTNIRDHRVKAQNVTRETMGELLNNTPAIIKEGSDSKVSYDQVKAALIDYAWNAPPPRVVPVVDTNIEPPEPVATTIDKLVKVLGYSYDAGNPENCKAILKYLPEARVPPPPAIPGAAPKEGLLKFAGQRLDAPIDHIRIVTITPSGVEFGYDEEGRENETLLPADFDLHERLAYVDPAQLRSRPDVIVIPNNRNYVAPTQTQDIGRNRFRLGTEDVKLIGDDFPRILSEEVRSRRHKDPKTGRYDGIEITSVAPNSVASRHGAQSGDVIKSINGHSVTSQQEAINFVKNNEDMYEKWEVVVSNLGQERTVTFYPPEK